MSIQVLILGAGPAGYTAAIYAARAGLQPTLYQGPKPGGQLMITSEVENYPGYRNGVLGPQMMEDFKAQAVRFGVKIKFGMATSVNFSAYPYKITIDGQHTITAQSVIITTGASTKWLGIPSEKRLNGKGVSACAVCDGFFFKGQDVAIVGGGDSAAEEALYLAKICKKVYVLVRRNQMQASCIMQERIKATNNIEVLWETQTKEILGDQVVEGVRVLHMPTGKQREISVQGFFVAIGYKPNTEIFASQLELDSVGYIKTGPKTTKTNVEGVFAGGDVQDHMYRQAVTAAGTGCMAALDAERFLSLKGGK